MFEFEFTKRKGEIKMKEEFIDVMLDIETLGVENGAQVIQIAAVGFKLGEEFERGKYPSINSMLDISTVGDKLELELGTLKFWTANADHAQTFNKLLSVNTGCTEEKMVHDIHEFLSMLERKYEQVRVWGNGIIFDNVKVENLFSKYEIYSPIKHYNHRDVRTIMDLASIKSGLTLAELRDQFKDGIERHDALDDCIYQIFYVNHANNILMTNTSEV